MVKQLPPKVLVATPENAFSTSVCNTIERYWFNTIKANKYEDITTLIAKNNPHIILISDTFRIENILNLISYTNNILPFVILASDNITYNFDSELVEILKIPFTPYEIIDTIRSLLRKSKHVFQNTILTHNDITMNLATYRVSRGKRLINLGPTEFTILQLLISEPHRIFSRIEIIKSVWGEKHQINLRTVDVHINRIRDLLKNVYDKYHIIKTVRSLGYSMESAINPRLLAHGW